MQRCIDCTGINLRNHVCINNGGLDEFLTTMHNTVANCIDTMLTYLADDMIKRLLMTLKLSIGFTYRLDFARRRPAAISEIYQMKFNTGGTTIDNQNAHQMKPIREVAVWYPMRNPR